MSMTGDAESPLNRDGSYAEDPPIMAGFSRNLETVSRAF
jgi:hypothetical protein